MFPEIRRREPLSEVELPGASAVLQRIYASRGITAASELAYDLEYLPRFAELAGVRGYAGAATVFMSHCWGGRWGDLVAAACAGADTNRIVW